MDHVLFAFHDELEKISGVKSKLKDVGRKAHGAVDRAVSKRLGVPSRRKLRGSLDHERYMHDQSVLRMLDGQEARDSAVAARFLNSDDYRRLLARDVDAPPLRESITDVLDRSPGGTALKDRIGNQRNLRDADRTYQNVRASLNREGERSEQFRQRIKNRKGRS